MAELDFLTGVLNEEGNGLAHDGGDMRERSNARPRLAKPPTPQPACLSASAFDLLRIGIAHC